MKLKPVVIALALLGTLPVYGQGGLAVQETSALRATELRSDKLASAPVLATVPAGAALRLLSTEGGWAWVELTPEGRAKQRGWVRAGALNTQAGASTAAGLASGREAAGNTALTLGVRSLVTRSNRHALIIGISRYEDPSTPPLPGARIDKQTATQMAQAMQVAPANIKYLQDDQATGSAIRAAIQELTNKVQDGDRVFIHYSGHGTRFNDPAAGGCVEALLAYDGGQSGTITNHEMADLLKSITNKTDKLFVMYDSCHSGGVVQAASPLRTRGVANLNDEGVLRPKFAAINEECGRPVNVKTRNLVVEAVDKGSLPQDIVHVSASRHNEISFDDELKGGLATQFMRDCMLRDAKDLDGSGAISIEEIKQCAQEKINKRMQNDANFKPHNITLNGNAAFVPAWFSQPGALATSATAVSSTQSASASDTKPAAVQTASVSPPPALSAPIVPVALTGEQALRQMFDQRDGKRKVEVILGKSKLKIGQDALEFSVQSARAGYVYVAMAGSDNKSLHLLFPNDLDRNNKIDAGQKLSLPRPSWRIKAGGPVGADSLLVIVADGPRDLTPLARTKAGPFVTSLNDSGGRAQLGALMTTSQAVSTQACRDPISRINNPVCSDAYGAAMIKVEEVK